MTSMTNAEAIEKVKSGQMIGYGVEGQDLLVLVKTPLANLGQELGPDSKGAMLHVGSLVDHVAKGERRLYWDANIGEYSGSPAGNVMIEGTGEAYYVQRFMKSVLLGQLVEIDKDKPPTGEVVLFSAVAKAEEPEEEEEEESSDDEDEEEEGGTFYSGSALADLLAGKVEPPPAAPSKVQETSLQPMASAMDRKGNDLAPGDKVRWFGTEAEFVGKGQVLGSIAYLLIKVGSEQKLVRASVVEKDW